MKCPKCNKELGDKPSKFCPYCGSLIEAVKPVVNPQPAEKKVKPQPAEPEKKKKNILIPICILCILLGFAGLGIGVAAYLSNGNTADTKTEERADRNANRDADEEESVEKDTSKKEKEDTDEASVSSSSAESEKEDKEKTDSDKEKQDKKTDSDKEKIKKEKTEKEDQEAVAFIPEPEEETEKEPVVNPAGNTQASNSSASANQKPSSYVPASQNSGFSGNQRSDYGTYKLVNTDYLTLRSSATLTNKNNKILQIPANSELTVLDVGFNGYWKVNYNGTVGYVLPTYLAPCKGAVSVKKKWDYEIITDYVTLRDIPSTEGVDRGKITTGAIVECYDTADNGFVLVSYNGQLGYILTYYNGETLVRTIN